MITLKDYVIIAIVCLLAIAAIVGIAIVGQNTINAQVDILEETEIMESAETVVAETIPEVTVTTKPEETESPVEETEPVVETTTYTEPPITENPTTYTEATEPVVEETEATLSTEPTEPTVPVVEETEPVTESIPEPTEPPVEEEEATKDPYDPVELLACVIYQEAGSDSICDDCRYRVADVVLNRVADSRYPNTIHGVLTQSGQYGNYSNTGVVWPSRASNSGEKHAVQRAYAIAMSVVAGTHSELYGEGYIYQARFVQGVDNIYCCGHYFGR